MKTKLTTLLSFLFIFILISCGDDSGSDEYCKDPEASCPDDTAIEATACCTDTDCYWTYNGKKYACDGEDCSSVLTSIISDACESGTTAIDFNSTDIEQLKAQMEAVTQKLLIDARASSGCDL